MTEQQKEFLYLLILETHKYDDISKKLNLDLKTIRQWYVDLKNDKVNKDMRLVRVIWIRKNIKTSIREFYEWYISQERKCSYCGIKEEELNRLIDQKIITTKRIDTRGRTLELDRKISDLSYDSFENLTLACYWCNNAKTDTFSYEEFLPIGKIISEIWKKKLKILSEQVG